MKTGLSQILIPVALVFTIMISGSCKREQIELGVKHGDTLLSKEIFFSDLELGDITAIEVVDSVSLASPGILIVGRMGSATVNRDGEIIDKTIFDERGGLVVPVHDRLSRPLAISTKVEDGSRFLTWTIQERRFSAFQIRHLMMPC